MSKVLVTGSNGFIGGYVVEELLNRGDYVIGLDNYSKYGKIAKSYDHHPNYHFIQGDAQDVNLLTEILYGVDHFIAGAALIGGISYFHTLPYDLLAANDRITAAAFDASIAARRRGPLRKITVISSSMVYESTDHWPSIEGDELTCPPPGSSYGFQKLATEYYARAAWDQYHLPYTILRPFNCVGVGETQALHGPNTALALSHVVPDLITKALESTDGTLRILGSGDQVRHYTYGADLARGIVDSLYSSLATNEDFNLSTTEQTTVRQLAQKIWRRVHDEPLKLEFDEPYKYDVQCRVPDVYKASRLLGWEALTPLDTMLDEVVAWIRRQR